MTAQKKRKPKKRTPKQWEYYEMYYDNLDDADKSLKDLTDDGCEVINFSENREKNQPRIIAWVRCKAEPQ